LRCEEKRRNATVDLTERDLAVSRALLYRSGYGCIAGRRTRAGGENDFVILAELELVLTEAGAEVIVSQTVQDALAKTDEGVSAAVLDFALLSETVEPVASHLAECGVPFVFYTGHLGTDELLAKWPGSMVIQKPADAKTLVAAVASLLGR
jgi:DNA-binding response OmpR family regulator